MDGTADTIDDAGIARGVAVSTSSQLGAKVVHLCVNIVSTLAIIRYLGPDGYGDYVLALTVTLLVGLVADFGLADVGVREVARRRSEEHVLLGSLVLLRVGLAVVAMSLTQIVLLVLGSSGAVHLAAAVASSVFIADGTMTVLFVAFRVRLRQHYEAMVRLVAEIGETALLLWLITRDAPMPVLFVPVALAAFAAAGATWWLAHRSTGIRLRPSRSHLRPLVRAALPVGPALLIGVAYLKLDSLLLAAFRTPHEVGLYGAAYQPIEYLFLGGAVVVHVLFPLLAAAWGAQRLDRFTTLYRRGTEVLVAATLVVPLTVLVVAEPMLDAVYGPDYVGAAPALRILAVVLVLMTVNAWQSFVLLAGDRQADTLRYNLAALALATVLGIVAVQSFGMVGAATAALGTGLFVLAASTRAVHRHLEVGLDGSRLGRIAGAAACTVLVTGLLHRVEPAWLLLVVATGLAYLGALMAFGAVRPAELGALVHRARRPAPAAEVAS